jgi:hypothetical protein
MNNPFVRFRHLCLFRGLAAALASAPVAASTPDQLAALLYQDYGWGPTSWTSGGLYPTGIAAGSFAVSTALAAAPAQVSPLSTRQPAAGKRISDHLYVDSQVSRLDIAPHTDRQFRVGAGGNQAPKSLPDFHRREVQKLTENG